MRTISWTLQAYKQVKGPHQSLAMRDSAHTGKSILHTQKSTTWGSCVITDLEYAPFSFSLPYPLPSTFNSFIYSFNLFASLRCQPSYTHSQYFDLMDSSCYCVYIQRTTGRQSVVIANCKDKHWTLWMSLSHTKASHVTMHIVCGK